MNQSKILKVSEVAKLLRMNRMTIYKLAKANKLPGVKIGGEWRFDADTLEKYLKVSSLGLTEAKISKRKAQARIMVVDDDPGIRDLFERILEDEGYKVYLASSAKECIDLLKKDNCHVVLLDLKMADINGLDTLRLIRSYRKDIAVIIITAYATIDTAIEAMKIGAYDYIAKPFDNNKIISLIREALKNKN